MVLAVSPGDGRRESLQNPVRLLRLGIGTVKRHRRRIVVQLVQTDLELLDDLPHDGQHEIRVEGREQAVQAAAETIIVEAFQIVGRQTEQSGCVAAGPFGHAIDRLPPCCNRFWFPSS